MEDRDRGRAAYKSGKWFKCAPTHTFTLFFLNLDVQIREGDAYVAELDTIWFEIFSCFSRIYLNQLYFSLRNEFSWDRYCR